MCAIKGRSVPLRADVCRRREIYVIKGFCAVGDECLSWEANLVLLKAGVYLS